MDSLPWLGDVVEELYVFKEGAKGNTLLKRLTWLDVVEEFLYSKKELKATLFLRDSSNEKL